ncbi:MAG TPA: hypothetical protein VGM63_04565 [Mucilaginibacter sp.]|jgi:uncharacterized protein YigE (DUF2233 family)
MSNKLSISLMTFVLLAGWSNAFAQKGYAAPGIISYTADPQKQAIRFYWKDDSGHVLASIQRLKDYLDLKHEKLVLP